MAGELAEQLIRLRRFRGLSQGELAAAIGTKQAAISRHESGASNISAKTLEAMLEALQAIIRIDLIPQEMEEFRTEFPRWWVAAEDQRLSVSTQIFTTFASGSFGNTLAESMTPVVSTNVLGYVLAKSASPKPLKAINDE